MINKKSLFYEHDYCGANFTWNIEDRGFNKKLTRNTVDKWTNRLSVHVHADDNLNKSIARELAIYKVQYSFLPEQQIRGKVFMKFGIPTVMGGILSRASIFSGSISNEFSQKRRKNSSKMSRTGKIAKLEAISQLTSEEMRQIVELKNSRISDIRKGTIDNSQIITNESEILPTFLSQSEFPEDAQISPKIPRKLTPFYPSVDTHSIYSQTTQVPTQNSQLPDFQKTFGGLTQISNLEVIEKNSSNQHFSTLSAKSLVLTDTSKIFKDTELPGCSQLSLTLADTQKTVDPDDLSTQSLSLSLPIPNKRLITPKSRPPIRCRGQKKKEPESLWTDIEETYESRSPIIEINDGVSQFSNTNAKSTKTTRNQLKYQQPEPESLWTDFEETCEIGLPIIDKTVNDVDHWDTKVVNPCNISIGTSLSAPEFLIPRSQAVETVDHDHCYDDKSDKTVFHTRKSDFSKSNSDRYAANVHCNKFSKDQFKKMRTVEHGMVKKNNKRKADYYMNKGSPVQNSSYYDSRSLAQIRRLSLNDLNENDAKSPEFPMPAGKRVRLLSPDNEHKSLKNRNSAISSRILTPFYTEYKNTKRPGLTPFYTSLQDMDRCDSITSSIKQRNIRQQRMTPNYSDHKRPEPVVIDISSDNEDENKVEKRLNERRSFYSKEKKYEQEIIDISADTEDASIGKLEINHFGTKASQLAAKVKTSSQTVLSSVTATIVNSLPSPTNIPVASDDRSIPSLLKSQCSIAVPVPTNKLFSNLCCEYDYTCRNVPSGEVSMYQPKLLKHLVVSTDEEIRKNIDKALKFLESLFDKAEKSLH